MSQIKTLNNPMTWDYLNFKEFIFSFEFPWFYYPDSTDSINKDFDREKHNDIPFYSHEFLTRPSEKYNNVPKIVSPYFEKVSSLFLQIFEHNNVEINYFLRINANCVHSFEKIFNTVPHVDHHYYHKNCIIYLTNSGGSIIVENEMYEPKEDDIITFGGEVHYHQTPKKDRRIVLVATFV